MRFTGRGQRLNTSVSRAAVSYFAIVFATGFVLGTIRSLLIAPRFGELPAVVLESPIMLLVSWMACGRLIDIFRIRGSRAGLIMGAISFAVLMIAELVLSIFVFRRSPSEFLGQIVTPAGTIGFMSQAAYGIMPWIRSAWTKAQTAR